MTIYIPDGPAAAAGLTEAEARVELACRLFDEDRIGLQDGSQFAGVDRVVFEQALTARGIALYRPTVDDILADVASLKLRGLMR